MTTLSAIVLTWRGRAHIGRCLASLAAQTEPPDETVVVDNGSDDDTPALVRAQSPRARLVELERNVGFAPGMNVGARLASGDVVLFLNQDVELRPTACAALRQTFAAQPGVGIAGAKLLEGDGITIQHAGGWLLRPLFLAQHYGHGERDAGQHDRPRAVEYVNGAVLGVRRGVFAQLGGFDEGFAPAYFEETDLCFRARALGQVVWYEPRVVAVHYGAATLGQTTRAYYACYHRGRVRFALKHAGTALPAFFAAERARLRESLSAAERAGLAEAYVVNALRWRGGTGPDSEDEKRRALNLSPSLPHSDSERGMGGEVKPPAAGTCQQEGEPMADSRLDVAAELAALRAQVYAARGQQPPDTPAAVEQPPAPGAPADPLAEQATLREHVFRSRLPLVGGLVAAFRRLWNDVSTTWYVRSLIEQQTTFNTLLVQRLAELDERLAETDRELALVLREVAALREAVARVERAMVAPGDHRGQGETP